jgi:hypothetical protein
MSENQPATENNPDNQPEIPRYVMVVENKIRRPRKPPDDVSRLGSRVIFGKLLESILLSFAQDPAKKRVFDHVKPDKPRKPTPFTSSRIQAPRLTPLEQEILLSIHERGVKFTALEMGTSDDYIYLALHRIRQKERKSWFYLALIEDYMRKFPRLRKFLYVPHDYGQV